VSKNRYASFRAVPLTLRPAILTQLIVSHQTVVTVAGIPFAVIIPIFLFRVVIVRAIVAGVTAVRILLEIPKSRVGVRTITIANIGLCVIPLLPTIVTSVAPPVQIPVALVRVTVNPTVVADISNLIKIVIRLRWVRIEAAVIAHVPTAILIPVTLIRIRCLRAVVATVSALGIKQPFVLRAVPERWVVL
jgi:hypothetical protein